MSRLTHSPIGILFLTLLSLSSTSCFLSLKPVYNDKEQAVAERAVSQFHDYYNQSNFEGIYELVETTLRSSWNKEKALRDLRSNFETLGTVKASRLIEQKIFPGPSPEFSSQVRLGYETTFEKGTKSELFVWNIKNSSEALLVDYIIH